VPALPVLAAVPSPPLGPIWVALLIAAAASAVAVGQQCARRPVPLAEAAGKLVAASAIGAVVMALLGYAGGGRLGNFGDVGVDQTTFGPAVFLWFVAIGGLTVVMSGGIARRTKVRAERVPDPEPETVAERITAEEDVPDVEGSEEQIDDEELIDDEEQIADNEEPIDDEIVVAEPEDPQPVFEEPVPSPAPVRVAPRDVFDFDDDPEAHYFADDDHTSDQPRRSSD
jgi:hypothetical protein